MASSHRFPLVYRPKYLPNDSGEESSEESDFESDYESDEEYFTFDEDTESDAFFSDDNYDLDEESDLDSDPEESTVKLIAAPPAPLPPPPQKKSVEPDKACTIPTVNIIFPSTSRDVSKSPPKSPPKSPQKRITRQSSRQRISDLQNFPRSRGRGRKISDAESPKVGLATTGASSKNVEPLGLVLPATAKPATAKPAPAKPATAEPATARPATAKPATAKPATAKPATAEPATSEPASAEPTWYKSGDFKPNICKFTELHPGLQISNLNQDSSVLEFFHVFFPLSIIEMIAKETNRYYKQLLTKKKIVDDVAKRWFDTSAHEILNFLALIMLMPHVLKSSFDDYWKTDRLIFTPVFGEVLSRNRFRILLRSLHFNDNTKDNGTDRLFKIRPIYDFFKEINKKIFHPYENVAIDESLIKHKGRLAFKCYNPKKRARFGIKVFVLADCKTGLILDIIPYTGAKTELKYENLQDLVGMPGRVVLSLMDSYLNKGYKVWADNWYNSPALGKVLLDYKTNICGTIRGNRKGLPKKNLKKLDENEMEWLFSDNLLYLRWFDKRVVGLFSTMHNKDEVIDVQKTKKKDKSEATEDSAKEREPKGDEVTAAKDADIKGLEKGSRSEKGPGKGSVAEKKGSEAEGKDKATKPKSSATDGQGKGNLVEKQRKASEEKSKGAGALVKDKAAEGLVEESIPGEKGKATKAKGGKKKKGKASGTSEEIRKIPVMVREYNRFMGAIDLHDMMLSFYLSRRKSRKWYRKLFFYIFDTLIRNACILHNIIKEGKKMSLKKFRFELIRQILETYTDFKKPRPGRPMKSRSRSRSTVSSQGQQSTDQDRPSTSQVSSNQQGQLHYPLKLEKAKRKPCVVCSEKPEIKNENERRKKEGLRPYRVQSYYMCPECDVGLCATPCFEIFHTKKKN